MARLGTHHGLYQSQSVGYPAGPCCQANGKWPSSEWLVVYVETASAMRVSEVERERVSQTLNLAEQLGAETLILSGYKVSDTLLAYAHERNVNKIIIGKPVHTHWHDL